MKEIANTSINELLKFTKIDYEVIEDYKTEFTELKNKRYLLDYVGKTKDKICLHLEFQARIPTKEELKKIFAYAALLHDFTDCFVETYIMCVQAIPQDHIIYHYSEDNVFKIKVISLKNIDGNEKINSISKKIENNEELTETEKLALKLIPFTSYTETTEEMTLKTARLTNKIKTLSEDELNKIKYIQQAVCSKVIEKEHQDKIMEEIKMRNTLYDQARKEGREEGADEKELEIKNEIKTLMKEGTLPPNTLDYINSLKM